MEFSILTIILSFSVLYSSTHPLVMCVLLISLAIMLSIVLNSLLNKWLMLSLVLIFLGGMMVIFIYMTALASNEKLFLSYTYSFAILLVLGSTIWLTPTFFKLEFIALSPIYSSHLNPLLLFLALYLLICLFAVVKLCSSFKGALMKFF